MKPKDIITTNKKKIIKWLEVGVPKKTIATKLGFKINNFDKYYWKRDPDYKIAKAKRDAIISNIFE